MGDLAKHDISLSLFFTRGLSLKRWAEVGNLEREMAIYEKLSRQLKGVNIVTYGGAGDKDYEKYYGNINILTTSWSNNSTMTALKILFRYFPEILQSDVLKTNQILGSEVPVWLKKKLGKKLIVRCGYLYSYIAQHSSLNEETIEYAMHLERDAFTSADLGVVTTPWQREIVIEQYGVDEKKIKVVPNYVVTDVFHPAPQTKKKYDLVFVGRSGHEKNLISLLTAMRYLKEKNNEVSLLMIGTCCSDKEIMEYVRKYDLDITFKGNIPNFQLPQFLNEGKVFVLPSRYEGHPKALLEAMSCGMGCIGSDVEGIREDIEHLKTGFLCHTDAESLAHGVERVLSDEALRKTMGSNAREYILSRYSLEIILEKELEVIQEVVSL